MGPGELLLIAMLGLIIFGPGRLPEIAAQVGRAVRDLRRSTAEITREFQEAIEPLQEMADFPNELSREVRSVGDDVKAVGAAAVHAQGGAATQDGEPAKPALPAAPAAEEWHWEGGEAASANGRMTADSQTAAFWEWDAPEPPPATEAPAAMSAAALATPDAVWEWDPPEPGPSQSPDGAAAALAPVAEVANGAVAKPRRRRARKTAAEDGDPGAEPGLALAAEGDEPAPRKPRRRKKAESAELAEEPV
jgi:TatA/E family protein of Tat protein translocase